MRKFSRYTYLLSFLLFAAAMIANRLSFYRMQWYAGRVDHTRAVIQTLQRIEDNFKSAQIYSPAGDTGASRAFYQAYRSDALSIRDDLHRLKGLVGDNPVQVRRSDTLAQAINSQVPGLLNRSIIEMVRSGETAELAGIMRIHQVIDRAIAAEDELLAERKANYLHFTKLTNWLSLVLAMIAVVLIIVTSLLNVRLRSKRKWLEGFLDSIVNTTQNGIIYFKAVRNAGSVSDFVIEYCNKSIADLVRRRPEAIVEKRLLEVFPSAQGSGLFEKLMYVQNSGSPTVFEMSYQEDGRSRWMLVALTRLNDGVTGSFHDISKIKDYEEVLKEKIAQLERSNTELEQYAYVASHDLQEPLRKIKTFGTLLKDTQGDQLDPKGKMQLDRILSASDRMSVLIKDILNYSSLKKEQEYTETDLNAICVAAAEDLNLAISQKAAVLSISRLPVIQAIPLQMTQLFYNLLNNALKFSRPDRPPHVTIDCRLLTDSDRQHYPGILPSVRYFEIRFGDNGIGFSQENAEQIFGMFKRLTDKTAYPGSGIGLALCRKVVENHHGWIRAQGAEGVGANFYIVLPEKQIRQDKASSEDAKD